MKVPILHIQEPAGTEGTPPPPPGGMVMEFVVRLSLVLKIVAMEKYHLALLFINERKKIYAK